MEENQNQNPNTEFMKETIKQRPLNRKKLLRRTLITAAMAVVFGMVACLTFLLLEPVISNKLYPEQKPSTVVLEEEVVEDEILPEDMIVDESEMEQPEEIAPPALEEEQIAQVLSKIELGTSEYLSLYNSLADVAKQVQSSMVTVVGITSDVDWFNNVYESEGSVSGVIIADNGVELLILTSYDAIKDADTLEVLFSDNSECAATLKKVDQGTGFAVLAVTKSVMSEATAANIQPVRLGTSSTNGLVGTPVIALGQPMGTANSLSYGMITAAEMLSDIADSRYKLITTDIYGSTLATGILINLNGQVIGIMDNGYKNNNTPNLISAIGITELRKVIERMSNDMDIPYMGIHGADVPTRIHEELEVPFGVYVKEVDMDSPAMKAGIQSGDVIAVLDEKEVANYQEFTSVLLEHNAEDVITAKILRQGADGYIEMDQEITLGIR